VITGTTPDDRPTSTNVTNRLAARANDLTGRISQTGQVVNAVIRIETSNPGSSTPSLAT